MHAKRHPIFEGLVFGLAGLLALIIAFAVARQLYFRYSRPQAAPDEAPAAFAAAQAAAPPARGSDYLTAPAVLPPAEITSPGPARKDISVPAPAR